MIILAVADKIKSGDSPCERSQKGVQAVVQHRGLHAKKTNRDVVQTETPLGAEISAIQFKDRWRR